jgi:hypothetical protein
MGGVIASKSRAGPYGTASLGREAYGEDGGRVTRDPGVSRSMVELLAERNCGECTVEILHENRSFKTSFLLFSVQLSSLSSVQMLLTMLHAATAHTSRELRTLHAPNAVNDAAANSVRFRPQSC